MDAAFGKWEEHNSLDEMAPARPTAVDIMYIYIYTHELMRSWLTNVLDLDR